MLGGTYIITHFGVVVLFFVHFLAVLNDSTENVHGQLKLYYFMVDKRIKLVYTVNSPAVKEKCTDRIITFHST